MSVLEARDVGAGYAQKQVAEHINLCIRRGEILSILGPNGSGKSTVLQVLSRILKPSRGVVCLQGENIQTINARRLARLMAVLPQFPQAPGGISVKELVACGRYPHRNWWRISAPADREAIDWALSLTGLTDLADRTVMSLSGGEQQRAWIAMALAQRPEIFLLDEPTTHLDICHQLELLELIKVLNRQHGITVVMAVHDINQAARYSDQVIVLKNGKIFAAGTPREVITAQMLREVFGVEADVWPDGETGKPVFIVRGLVKNRN